MYCPQISDVFLTGKSISVISLPKCEMSGMCLNHQQSKCTIRTISVVNSVQLLASVAIIMFGLIQKNCMYLPVLSVFTITIQCTHTMAIAQGGSMNSPSFAPLADPK